MKPKRPFHFTGITPALTAKYAKESDYVFFSVKLRGKKPLSASVMVQKYLRPAA
ncbi:MAG TPA: hypothetical protein VEK33_19555 [Terriglobales bacterium]|nr:hypothetical protein [Terriglobales bacterium]